jgi:hypothetical protein
LISPSKLFLLTFIVIISIYIIVFGEVKTFELIKAEYLFILALLPISLALLFFKFKLKDYQLINFNKNNTFSLKATISFFIIFQVVDYFYEDGFIGMISQWFLYWIMGVITLLLLETINHFN